MNSDKLEIEEFLDHIDEWKFKLHERLKRMTPVQRKAFWNQIRDDALSRRVVYRQKQREGELSDENVRRRDAARHRPQQVHEYRQDRHFHR